jgi:hypothetical protein
MVHGGCLCGGVRFEISGELSKMHFCHCQMCRRGHGTPYANYVAVNPRDIHYTQGEELISRYQSSETTSRTFCNRCGSNLEFSPEATPDETWIASGGFDGDPKVRPTFHIYVDSKAPWFEITDNLKQYPASDD